MPTRTHRPRILIYRLGSLGDTLVALPALNLVARAFPGAERRMLTNVPIHANAPPAAAILEHTGLVHGFFRYPVGTRSLLHLLALWWQMVRWHPDVLVYAAAARGVPSAKRDALFFRLCGIRRFAGVPLTQDMQRPRPQSDGTWEPEASRLTRNLAALGPPGIEDPANWDLRLTLQEQARAAEVLLPLTGRPLIAVSLGTKVQAKDWGHENWRTLLDRLAVLYPTHALALCGAAEDHAPSEAAATAWRVRSPDATLNLCGLLSPRESAAILARAVLFLGHDSGPMHLAAAAATPCVAIFAARNLPGVWFPRGSAHRILYRRVDCAGCGLDTCIAQKKKCILSIAVEEVLAEVAAVLPPAAPSPPIPLRPGEVR